MEREISREQIDSLVEKLDSFERSLTLEEREVLAAVFAAARGSAERSEAEVEGFRIRGPGGGLRLRTDLQELQVFPLSTGFRTLFENPYDEDEEPVQA